MNIRNAIISETRLGINDHNILDAHLILDYGEETQGFGGYALYLPESYRHHSVWGTAGHFIFRCLQIAGVEKWSQIVGKSIRVKQESAKVHAIGHIIKDDWFNPAEDFKGHDYSDMQGKPAERIDQWEAIAEELARQCERQHRLIQHMLSKEPGYFCSEGFKPSKESVEEWIKFAKQSIKDEEE